MCSVVGYVCVLSTAKLFSWQGHIVLESFSCRSESLMHTHKHTHYLSQKGKKKPSLLWSMLPPPTCWFTCYHGNSSVSGTRKWEVSHVRWCVAGEQRRRTWSYFGRHNIVTGVSTFLLLLKKIPLYHLCVSLLLSRAGYQTSLLFWYWPICVCNGFTVFCSIK